MRILNKFFISLALAVTGVLPHALSTAVAQQPPVAAHFRDFSGGLRDNADASELEKNESPDLMNVIVDDPVGSVGPRSGFTQCGVTPSGNKATMMFPWAQNNGSKVLAVTDNATVWTTKDCDTYTTVGEGHSSSKFWDMAIVRDKLWMVNGSTPPVVWDGTTKTVMEAQSGTPNPAPPTGRYIDYGGSIVWIARTSSDPDLVQWSALTDTSGNDMDPSTGSVSWPATNAVYVDRDGGGPIRGIKWFRNDLYVCKDNGMYRLVHNSDFDVSVIKTLAAGCRQNTTFAEIDNLLYYLGADGVYAFDGQSALRISDKIAGKIGGIKQSAEDDLQQIWTTNADFNAGTVSSASVISNSIVLSTQSSTDITNGDFEFGAASPMVFTFSGPNTSGGVSTSWAINGTYGARIQALGVGPGGDIRVVLYRDSDDAELTRFEPTVGSTSESFDVSDYEGILVYLKFEAEAGASLATMQTTTFTAKTNVTWNQTVTEEAAVGSFDTLDDIFSSVFLDSGVYTSEVVNLVTVSSWSTFDIDQDLNGGTIDYQIKVGTNANGLANESFVDIQNGDSIVGTASEVFVQWKATFTANSGAPSLHSVVVNYSQGDVSDTPPFGFVHDRRYIITGATGTSSTNNIALVKSRSALGTAEKVPASWTVFDWQIGPMVDYNDKFYAGASTHSGIYLMDSGDDDNGAAIGWYWTSRDEFFGNPYRRVYLNRMTVDFRRDDAANMVVSYSKDNGVTWTDSAVIMSGTGKGSKRLNVGGSNALSYRFRIYNNTQGEEASIQGISAYGRPFAYDE